MFKFCKFTLFVMVLSTVVNARYFVLNGWNNGGSVDPRTPADIMVDVTNNIGLQVLECHNINNHNNIAFSPYGLTSVLIALQEGVTGEAALQIHRTARFPFDRDIIRVGFRDIHRLLRSYFVPKEGFLAGLSLNNDNITLTPGYKSILQFYGYDLQPNMTTSTALPPETTTVMSTVLSGSEKPTSSSPEMPSTSVTSETTTTMASEAPEVTTMKPETNSMSSETTTEAGKAIETTESVATTMMSVMSTMSAMTAGETTIVEEATPVMTSPPTTEAVEIMTTPKTEPETTTTQKAEPESTTTLPPETTTQESELETTTTQKPEPETTTTQKSEPETTMAEEPKPETTTPKPEIETTIAEEPKSETTTVSEASTEPPATITTESVPEMTPEATTVSTTVPETTSAETVTMPDVKEEETTMSMTMTPEAPPENSEEPPEEPEIENNSPETLEYTDTNTDETASASVSSESSNEIETLSIEEMTTLGKSTTNSEELTTSSLETETMTTETESPRRKRSLADYLIARHYDGQNYFTFQEPIVTSIPPVQSRQYPFLVNGIKEQYNVNYTEYDTVLPFTYLPLLRSLALKFPLDSDKYYLLIVLPLNPQGVNTLICDIRKYDTLRNIIRNLKDTYVRAIIPSFMLKGFVFLTNTLQRLGIHNIFEPGHADFSLMTEDENIYVTNIEQAVTVTIRNYMESSIKKRHYYNYRPVEFKVTHPFIYFIMDSTLDVTLMAGKVVNPLNARIQ